MVKKEAAPGNVLATRIRCWYWDYVRSVQGIPRDEPVPGARRHPLYDGNLDTIGRAPQSIWLQLEQWALDTKVDVQVLLRQLAELHKGKFCITPYQIPIFSVKSIERALAARRQQELSDLCYRILAELLLADEAWQSLTDQVLLAKRNVIGRNEHAQFAFPAEEPYLLWCAELTDAEISEYVLCDQTLNLSPLVRLFLAYYLDVSHLATYYGDQATQQYRSNPDAYDAMFGNWLPAKFRAAARAGLG